MSGLGKITVITAESPEEDIGITELQELVGLSDIEDTITRSSDAQRIKERVENENSVENTGIEILEIEEISVSAENLADSTIETSGEEGVEAAVGSEIAEGVEGTGKVEVVELAGAYDVEVEERANGEEESGEIVELRGMESVENAERMDAARSAETLEQREVDRIKVVPIRTDVPEEKSKRSKACEEESVMVKFLRSVVNPENKKDVASDE